jgi:hypothetical protein
MNLGLFLMLIILYITMPISGFLIGNYLEFIGYTHETYQYWIMLIISLSVIFLIWWGVTHLVYLNESRKIQRTQH